MSKRCSRCTARAVVEASELCLACGHVGRPGQDRNDTVMSSTHAAVVDRIDPLTTDESRFDDEEAG